MQDQAAVRGRYKTLRELAQEAIFADILSGRLKPGARLLESELVAQYGISRGPLREALRALEGQGLLRATSNRGSIVASLSREEVREIYEIRVELDGLATRLATPRLSERELTSLRSLLKKMSDATAVTEKWMRLNDEFHHGIYAASGRHRLTHMIQELAETVRPYVLLFLEEPARLLDTHGDHAPLLDALERRDAHLAERLTQEHLQRAAVILAGIVPEADVPTAFASDGWPPEPRRRGSRPPL